MSNRASTQYIQDELKLIETCAANIARANSFVDFTDLALMVARQAVILGKLFEALEALAATVNGVDSVRLGTP